MRRNFLRGACQDQLNQGRYGVARVQRTIGRGLVVPVLARAKQQARQPQTCQLCPLLRACRISGIASRTNGANDQLSELGLGVTAVERAGHREGRHPFVRDPLE